MSGCVLGTDEQRSFGSWESQRGPGPLFVSAEETVPVVTGSCVCLHPRQACVFACDVSAGTNIVKWVLLLLLPHVSLQVCRFQVFDGCQHCVCVLLPMFPSELHMTAPPPPEGLPFALQPITVSRWPHTLPGARPTHLCPRHSRPFFSLISTLLPSLFLCLSLPIVPVFARQSAEINPEPFQLDMTVHTCGCTNLRACTCVSTHRETNMKQMFRRWRSEWAECGQMTLPSDLFPVSRL